MGEHGKNKTPNNPVIPDRPQPKEENAEEKFTPVEEVVKKEFDKHGYDADILSLKGGQKFVISLMIGVMLVLFIAFLTFWYDQQRDKIQEDYRIQDQQKQLEDDRYKLLQKKYDFLEQQIKASTQSGG